MVSIISYQNRTLAFWIGGELGMAHPTPIPESTSAYTEEM